MAGVEIEDFGRTIVAHNVADEIDAYGLLNLCDNVEREGEGSYRFDGVRPVDKALLIRALTGK